MKKAVKTIGIALTSALENYAAAKKVFALLSFETYEGSHLEAIYRTKEAAVKFCEANQCTLLQETPTELIYVNPASPRDYFGDATTIKTGYIIREMEVKS